MGNPGTIGFAVASSGSNNVSQTAFGFGAETDQEDTEMRFWIQFAQPGLPEETFELVAMGKTTVKRSPAKTVGRKFQIKAQIIDMPHTGQHDVLGEFSVNVDPDRPTMGVIEGSIDPKTKQSIIDAQHPAHGYFDVHFQVTTPLGVIGTGQQPARVENPSITTLFPDSPYTHAQKLAALKLFLAGKLSQPIAKLLAGYHYKKKGGLPVKSKGPCEPCECERTCKVVAKGQCGKFSLQDKDGLREQLLFVASQYGVPASPLGLDRVLAYITVTNGGPQPVTVYWDGPPPTYETPLQSAIILPGNSITLAVSQSVKVVCSPSPNLGPVGDSSNGCYVISWCCPDLQGGMGGDSTDGASTPSARGRELAPPPYA
jgi:hypothetical protein